MIYYKHNKWTFFGDWMKGRSGTVANFSDVPFSQGKRTLDEIKIYKSKATYAVYRNYRIVGNKFKRVEWFDKLSEDLRELQAYQKAAKRVKVPF